MKILNRNKLLLCWGGFIAFPITTYYCGVNAVYFAWLNAYDPVQYSVEIVGLRVYTYYGFTILSILLFVLCIVLLVRHFKNRNRVLSVG